MGKATKDTPKGKTPKARRDWKTPFLAALADGSSVKCACLKADVARRHVYRTRETDPAFALAWDDASEDGTDVMEDEAKRRAVEGVEKPIFHQGVEIARVREYSDALIKFLITARRPDKYREAKGDTNIIISDERNAADPEAAKRALEAASTTKPRLRIEP